MSARLQLHARRPVHPPPGRRSVVEFSRARAVLSPCGTAAGAAPKMKRSTNILNADLHCHSVVSDGTLTPEALGAERAKSNGVELWALTDHDEIGGQHRARARRARAGHALPHRRRDFGHVFAARPCTSSGLGFDADNDELARACDARAAGAKSAPWKCPTGWPRSASTALLRAP